MLTNVDINGKAIEMPYKINKEGIPIEQKSMKIEAKLIAELDSFSDNGMRTINQMEITDYDKSTFKNIGEYFENYFKPFVNEFDYKNSAFFVVDIHGNSYSYDEIKETIIVTDKDQKVTELGNGKINIKTALKKATKTIPEHIVITVELTKDLQKDYEIIPYSPDEAVNQQTIADFMAKYITRPFEYVDNVIGVELNFNKVFYVPEKLRTVTDIQAEIDSLNLDLKRLEDELDLI